MAVLTAADLDKLEQRLAEARDAERAEALSSLSSLERWLAYQGLYWLWGKLRAAATDVMAWLKEVFLELL